MPIHTHPSTGSASCDDYADAQFEELLDTLDPAELELAETIARQRFRDLSERAIASMADQARRLLCTLQKDEKTPAGRHF